jgi:signal transduction histidine kinase
MGDQISFVEGIVKDEPKETALALLKIAKNNAAMKVEFSVFKKLFDSNPDLQKREHNVHKVLMNVFYLFFPDFTDKNVKVIVGDNYNKYTAFFDYESLHVALYHIVENAAKYIRPNTTLTVSINNHIGLSEIIMDMISIEIKQDEKNRIFDEGVSGYLACKIGKAGAGIGMSRAKKIIELNSGSIAVKPYPETAEVTMGFTFQRNVFTIELPRRASKA